MADFRFQNCLHGGQTVYTAGERLSNAWAAMVLIHGRGASASDILLLGEELYHPQFTYLAPQAAGNTWYPYSFLAPITQNEPWLTSALEAVAAVVQQVEEAGVDASRIVLGGFSQGACLAGEFAGAQSAALRRAADVQRRSDRPARRAARLQRQPGRDAGLPRLQRC